MINILRYKYIISEKPCYVYRVVLSVTDLATARIRREAASDSGAELSSASWRSTCERLLGFVGERLDEAAQSRKEVCLANAQFLPHNFSGRLNRTNANANNNNKKQ